MKRASYFADIHLHPTLKSSNWTKKDGLKNPWETFEHITPTTVAGRFAIRNTPTMAKYTQSNFTKLMEGDVKVAFISLYPFERGFMNLRNMPRLLTNRNALMEMTAISSGMGLERVNQIFDTNDYFKELHLEYEYVKKHQGKSPDGKYSYRIVNNYKELQESLAKKNELAVVLTAEGCHALFDQELMDGKMDFKEKKKRLKKNVIKMKEWEHPPFFVNLMHHFYNHLGGHARSLEGLVKSLLSQQKGLETGLEGLGLKTLKELLSTSNGKRVLIDTKHMSLKARKEYYNWVRTHNYISNTDNIPIICSHGGVNGFKSMSGSKIKPDNNAKKNKSYFFNWGINLSDEELRIIHNSQGIMGLIIDKGKLGGGTFLKKADREKDKAVLKDMYMKLIWDNLFQGVRAIRKKTAWDIFTLGTDFDGAINHVEFYDDATKMPTLYGDLYEYLDRTKYEKKLWHGYRPDELLNKLFSTNATEFLERNFV